MRRKLLPSTVALVLCTVLVTAQTPITAPENRYPISDDVKLGQEAAREARQQLPLMRDEEVTSYIDNLGQRLVAAIPTQFRHNQFRYTFDVINVREINAFALPGGPMFVNRGMIEASKTEGETAGVMAHEISHVALRHGTAQAGKSTLPSIVGVGGQILGAIIGGVGGDLLGLGSQIGAGAWMTKYSREYERQADLLGAQILARAGYDPREMANMFKTIEKQGGSGGPEWLSSHPNPSNRYDAINREAQNLRVDNPIRSSRAFEGVKSHLRTLPRAPTTEEAVRRAPRTTGGRPAPGDVAPNGRVEPPSTRYEQYDAGNVFSVSVPANWRQIGSRDGVTFAPEGGYGQMNGRNVFTHGMQFGLATIQARNLKGATNELIEAFRANNPQLTVRSASQQTSVDGRRALRTTLENVSDVTGRREGVDLTTTQTPEGDLFFAIGVAPQNEYSRYQPVFQRVVGSVRLND